MTKQQAEAARARCDAATPGPWLIEGLTVYALQFYRWCKGKEEFANRFSFSVQPGFDQNRKMTPMPEQVANADFAANARTDLPDALDMLERAMALLERWEQGQVPPRELDAVLAEWRGK